MQHQQNNYNTTATITTMFCKTQSKVVQEELCSTLVCRLAGTRHH